MRIFLVGLAGSGKTTLGKQLAQLLKLEFIDMDAYIVNQEKKSIPDIFKENGEDYFREIESKSLKEVCTFKNAIISTGGGTPCFFDNMTVMNVSGITLFLDVPLATIAHRIWNSPQKNERPIFANKSFDELELHLKGLSEYRRPYYNEAKITIQGDAINAHQILSLLDQLD